jgi:predicted metal-dependent enzyme (double-stranded beta helix superfamily)
MTATSLPACHPPLRALPSRNLRARDTADLVRELAADPAFWREQVRHDPMDRWHTRLHWSPFVEVYLLGWTPEQDTRMHDHGGSVGAFAVADGELFEERSRAGSATTDRRRHRRGDVVAFGARHVHNLGNLGPAVATSIHVYSPPLPFMRFYEPDGRGRWQPSYRLAVDGPEPDDAARPVRLDTEGSS